MLGVRLYGTGGEGGWGGGRGAGDGRGGRVRKATCTTDYIVQHLVKSNLTRSQEQELNYRS